MANQIPVKAIYSGSDVTSLGEFTASDDITITYLPTGTSSSTVALGDHTHAYLPLAGGTMTGNLVMGSNLVDGIDISARDAVLTSTATTASAALPKSGGAMTGNITTNGLIDTVDIASRDGVLTTTTTTANAALPKAGGAMSGTITNFTSTGINDDSNANAITIDSNENVGIGPSIGESGMGSNAQALFVGAYGGVITSGAYESISLAENAYIGTASSDTWKYRETSHAARHEIKAGAHTFKVAASGTADADITWTNAMVIDNNGGVRAAGTTDTDTSNSGSITLDFATNQNFVLTLTGNVTLANPSTEVVGQSGFIAFIQDGTGSRTVALGTDYETAAAAGLTLTATASATDLVPYLVVASSRILLGTPQLAFA